jgi:hypothetical protein
VHLCLLRDDGQIDYESLAVAEPDTFGRIQCTLGNLKAKKGGKAPTPGEDVSVRVVTNFRENCGSKEWVVKLHGENVSTEGEFVREARYE